MLNSNSTHILEETVLFNKYLSIVNVFGEFILGYTLKINADVRGFMKNVTATGSLRCVTTVHFTWGTIHYLSCMYYIFLLCIFLFDFWVSLILNSSNTKHWQSIWKECMMWRKRQKYWCKNVAIIEEEIVKRCLKCCVHEEKDEI